MIKGLLGSRILLILCLYAVLASILSKAYIGMIMIPLVFIFHYIIPGLAMLKCCHYLEFDDSNKTIFSSFGVGYSFSIAIYIILLMLGIQSLTLVCSILISVISLMYLRTDILILLNHRGKDTFFLSVVLIICLGLGLLCFQCQHLSANIVGDQNMYYDDMFWFRNAVASTISYPLPDLSVMGNTMFYHYFSSIAIADLSFVTGEDLYNLCFSYSYLIRSFLVVGAAYVLVSFYINRRILLYVAVLLILFGTTFENLTYTNYIGHLYLGTLGFAEGFAMCLFSYFYYLRISNYTIRGLVLPLLVFMVAVGLKAPCALVVLGGIICYGLIQIHEKKTRRKDSLIVLLYTFCFILVMFLFVWNINRKMIGDGGNLSISIATAFRPPFFAFLYSKLNNVIPILPILFVFFFYIIVNYYLFIIGGILLYKRRKVIEWQFVDWSLFAMFMGGNCLFLFIDQLGFSQSYFYFISIPFGIILIMSVLEKYETEMLKTKDILFVKMTLLVALLCFICSIITEVDINKYYALFGSHSETQIVSGNSLTSDEFDALRWAKDNIGKNSIIVSNKILAENGSRSFVVSSYTEHQTYLEGYLYSASSKDKTINYRLNLLKRFFYNDNSAQDQLKLEGVTHVILFKNIPGAMPNVKGANVFENSSVVIYQI